MRTCITWMMVFAITTAPAVSRADGAPQGSANAAAPKLELRNVELTKNGDLHGQVINESGIAISGITITVQSQQDTQVVAETLTTGKDGRFVISGLRGGACVFNAGADTFACRVWTNGTAPPKSLDSIAVVPSAGDVVLGNGFMNRIRCMTPTQKALLVGLVAAAIILPIVLDDDDAS